MGGKPGGNNQNNQQQNFINQEFLCEFDQFQPVDANADPQNLIDPDSVLQEYQLLEQTQNAFAPQSLSSDNQDLSSIPMFQTMHLKICWLDTWLHLTSLRSTKLQ